MSQFSERLKKLRTERKIKQYQVGQYLGYGATAIVNYESGRNEPSIDSLIKLAEYFAVSVGYLVGSEKEPYEKNRLTQEEQELVFAFSKLSQAQKELLLARLKKETAQEKKSEEGESDANFFEFLKKST